MIAALSTIENAVYRVQSEEAVTYGHMGRANEITNYIMNNTVYNFYVCYSVHSRL
jgi:hypothetical protein